jgi:hypothetical protein
MFQRVLRRRPIFVRLRLWLRRLQIVKNVGTGSGSSSSSGFSPSSGSDHFHRIFSKKFKIFQGFKNLTYNFFLLKNYGFGEKKIYMIFTPCTLKSFSSGSGSTKILRLNRLRLRNTGSNFAYFIARLLNDYIMVFQPIRGATHFIVYKELSL